MITLFKKRVLQFLNKTSLWMQLAIFMTLICTVIAISLIYKDYTSTRKNIIHNFVETNTKLLNLEVNNLEDYLSNLANYCILPCYDSEFTRLINQPKSFSSTNISYLKQQMYYYYYTRNDIIDYHITFLNQKLSIGRSQNEQRMGTKHVSIDSMELLSNACFNSKFNHVILPSEKEDSFFTFYQALIKIKTQNPQAIVEVRVDKTALHTLLKNHSIDG